MLLRNFPLKNARPRGAEQTKNYVDALTIKRRADDFASKAGEFNETTHDLDTSPDGVALNGVSIYTDTLSPTRVMGAVSLGAGQDGEREVDSMHLQLTPKRESNRAYSYRLDGDRAHYTRKFNNQDHVTHLVHDLATDTINLFVRDEQGRFVSGS